MDNTALIELQELLVGATITAIEKPERSEDECIAVFQAERDDKVFSFRLHATDLGSWIGGEKVKTGGRFLYVNADDMVEDIKNHCYMLDYDEEVGPIDIQPLDDIKIKAIGFKCTRTGREWWTGLTAIKASKKLLGKLVTPEERQAFAKELIKECF